MRPIFVVFIVATLGLVARQAAGQPQGMLYSVLGTLNPSNTSHFVTIDVATGQVDTLMDLSSYGCGVGGAGVDLVRDQWFIGYGTSYYFSNQLMTLNLTTNSPRSFPASSVEQYTPWAMATLYGVWWNAKETLQQVVSLDPVSGDSQVVCDLPSDYGGPFAITRMASMDALTGRMFILIAYDDYKAQKLFTVNVNNGTFQQTTLPSLEYIIPTVAYYGKTDSLVGVGYAVYHGRWQLLNIDPATGKVTAIGNLPDSQSNVYDYTVCWLDQGSGTYFQLVSDINQDKWWVFSISADSGDVLYQAEIVCSNLSPSSCIPNHFAFVPSS